MNNLNADVRWTSACRGLDGGNTMILSNPSIYATATDASILFAKYNKKTTLRGGFLLAEWRKDSNLNIVKRIRPIVPMN
ncbi:MAG: hypothetical protein IKU68_05075 [Oscillospiraceae bacterium]|nr:hypothetical protein [Oscillospiraceae bacterium]